MRNNTNYTFNMKTKICNENTLNGISIYIYIYRLLNCICKQKKKTEKNNNKNRADLIRKIKSTLFEALL